MMTTDNANYERCPKCGAVVPADAPQGLCPKCVLAGVVSPTAGGVPATATSEIPSLERVASSFPQLEVAELIGRGGMGFVFKARQPHLDRWVALKLLPDKLAKDPQFAERFNREGRVLAKLNHPNIVSVFDFGKTEEFYYLLMEYVDGVNLRQAMHAGRFSPTEALHIVPKICEALQYAHEQGVLHRDIKPENILLDSKGRVKIADFGIAKLVGEDRHEVTLTGTGATLGTPHYMAPEQFETPNKVDHRADIYSLGVVFYEMLTGELPIGRFEPPSARTPVSTNVDEVVFRALERNRDKRFQSANEVKTKVEYLTASGAAAAPAGSPAAAVLLKESRCNIGTLEHARSLAGKFISVFQGTGTLKLYTDRLVYDGGVNRVNIPLGDIRAMGTGRYSAWAKPAGLDFLAITFMEAGDIRTLLFTMNASRTATAWDANQLTAEWRQAVGEAVRNVIGLLPPEPPAETLAMPGSRLAGKTLFLLGTLGACSVMPILFRSWFRGRPPAGYVEELLPFLLALLPGIVMAIWLVTRQRKSGRAIFTQPPPPPPAAVGPSGTMVLAAPKFSVKAIISAALSGMAWVLVGAPLMLAFVGGGMGFWELLVFGVPACVAGLTGTILGWIALSDIRAQAGRLRGLPLAVFGALACPLALLLLVTIAVPTLTVVGSGGIPKLVRALAMLVPAGVITFAVWAVYAAVRWGGKQPPARRRGVLKWVFMVAVLAGLGLALSGLLTTTGPGSSSRHRSPKIMGEPLPAGMIELVALSRHPSDGVWWNPDGQAFTGGRLENAGVSNTFQPGERAVEMVLRGQGLPADASTISVNFDDNRSFSGGGIPKLNGRPLAGGVLYAVTFPESKRHTTVRAGVAYGPWKTLTEDGRHAGSSVDLPYEGKRRRIAFRGAVEDKNGDTIVNMAFPTGIPLEAEQVRLVAVTTDGREHTNLLASRGVDHFQATFVKLPLGQIEKFQFQVRPYRWTEFKNVRLEPAAGFQVNVQVGGEPLMRGGAEPLRAKFKVPKGQVAIFTLSRYQGGTRQELPEMAGFVVAQDDETALGEVLLTPDGEPGADPAQRRWTMKITTEESPQVVVGSAALGALRPLAGTKMPLRLAPPEPPSRSLEMQLAQVEGPGGARGEIVALGMEYSDRPRNLVVGSGAMIGGGTNWENVLNLAAAMDAMNPNKNLTAEIKVRFTMTGINIREDGGARWLCLDYVANVDTNWVPIFRAEGDRFAVETRTTRLMEGIAGTVAVRHERAEIKLPAAFSAAEAEELAQSLTVSMVAQPFDVKAGREAPLFKGPLGNLGMLETAIGAVPVNQVPSVRVQFTNIELWQEGRRYCLGFDYTREGSAVLEVFRLGGLLDDASITTASTKFERRLGNNRPPEVTYRSSLTLPAALDEKAARALRQRAADAWVGKSVELTPGQRQQLLEWIAPGGAKSTLSIEGRLLSIYSTR